MITIDSLRPNCSARITVSTAWCLALLLLSPSAGADTAAELLEKGKKHFSMADFDGSLRLLERARKKAKYKKLRAQIYLYMGCIYMAKGRKAPARKKYLEALHLDPTVGIDARMFNPSIVTFFERVKSRLRGSVRVATSPAGAVAMLDGLAIGKTPVRKQGLSLGYHTLTIRLPGFEDQTRRIIVAPGRPVLVNINLVSRDMHSVPPLQLVDPFASSRGGSRKTQGAVAGVSSLGRGKKNGQLPGGLNKKVQFLQQRDSRAALAYGGLVTAVACTLGMAIVYGVALSNGSDAHERYMNARDPYESLIFRSQLDSAENTLVAGHILLGLAAVAAGVSVYGFATRPRIVPMKASAQGNRVQLSIVRGGAGVYLKQRF